MRSGRGKYCSKKCSDEITLIKKGQRLSKKTEFKKNQKPHNYKGKTTTFGGGNRKRYILVHAPDHPFATKSGYVREHRLVMEKELGRYLGKDEVVDHINGDTFNNHPSNLRVMQKRDHDRMNVKLNVHKRWQERE